MEKKLNKNNLNNKGDGGILSSLFIFTQLFIVKYNKKLWLEL
jgi:hypothetical protein